MDPGIGGISIVTNFMQWIECTGIYIARLQYHYAAII
jgi:hypothetical protein